MYGEKKRGFVCMVLTNERGYTFLHTIFALLIITVTFPVLIYLFQIIEVKSDENDLSVMQFFIILRNHILTAESTSALGNTFYFHLETGETVTIEQYDDVIRRQVNGLGHEIYLRNVQQFTLEPLDYGTKVYVTTLEGKTYEKIVAHY